MLTLCWKAKQRRSGGDPEAIVKLSLKALLVGAALLVLTVPAAHAQSGAEAIA
jgi:hypothetical protein